MWDILTLVPAAGLQGLWENIKSNYLGPIFLAAIAIFAIVFIKDRAWMKLASFIGIAAIVSLFIYNSDGIFGQGGSANNAAQDVANSLNVIVNGYIPGLLGR